MDDIIGSNFSCSTNQYHTDEVKILAIARFLCNHLGLPQYDVSISLVTKAEMQALNSEHRGKDSPTDVLSFPQEEFATPQPILENPPREPHSRLTTKPPQLLGDVIVCLDVANLNAHNIGQSLDRELAFLLVHGVLHLCGYDHENPKDEFEMLTAQRQLMTLLEQQPQGPLWADCAIPKLVASGGVATC